MSGAERAQARYFEDFAVGERFRSRGVTLTESQILDFAFKYDPQPFHLDREAAKGSPYGGLIASGFQTLALGFRMIFQENIFTACSLGSPGIDELRWLLPVRPDDTLTTEIAVREIRPSKSKPDRGTVVFDYRIENQRGEAVMTFRTIKLLRKRPSAEAGLLV
ncbi:MAG: MaoC family dehydratase [Kiloniellales bacterium]